MQSSQESTAGSEVSRLPSEPTATGSSRRGESGDNVRQLDWHFRTQLARRDQLLAEIKRDDDLINEYQKDILQSQERTLAMEKRIADIKSKTAEREAKRAVQEQHIALMRLQNMQLKCDIEAKKKKLGEKVELCNKLKENLPIVAADMKERLRKKQESIQDFRAAFGLPPILSAKVGSTETKDGTKSATDMETTPERESEVKNAFDETAIKSIAPTMAGPSRKTVTLPAEYAPTSMYGVKKEFGIGDVPSIDDDFGFFRFEDPVYPDPEPMEEREESGENGEDTVHKPSEFVKKLLSKTFP